MHAVYNLFGPHITTYDMMLLHSVRAAALVLEGPTSATAGAWVFRT